MIDKIFQLNPPSEIQQIIVVVLLWLGFAVLIGIIAQFIVPGKRNRGAVSALVIGLTSSCMGSMIVSRFYPDKTFNPIGLVGFLVSLILALVLLIIFQIFMFLFPIKKKENNNEDPENKE